MVMVVEVIMKLTVVIEMMWCWTWRLTWRTTKRLTRKSTRKSTSFLMSVEFEGPHGHYIMEKGLLHVNYVLTRFLVETT